MTQPVTDSWRSLLQATWAPLAVLASYAAVSAAAIEHEILPVDSAFHFAGGVAGAYFVERAYAALPGLLGCPRPVALRLIAFCVVCTAALFWEFGELMCDLLFGTRIQTDGREVLSDILLGAAGAICFGALSLWRSRAAAAHARSRPKAIPTGWRLDGSEERHGVDGPASRRDHF